MLFKLHWGGRGVKGEEWERLVARTSSPGSSACGASRTTCTRASRLGYFPAAADGNELVVFDPEDHERELERLGFPRQPKHDRICLTDFFRPLDSGERDVVALQGVTVGPEVTELMAQLERDGEFAEQLFTHGLGVQTAEGLAEWLHAEIRRGLGIELDQGRRYSWGYPACPDQSEHEKVWRLLELEQDRHVPLRRLRGDARAVDGGDRRPPPAGRLLRHEVGLHPQGEGRRRADRGDRARRSAAAPIRSKSARRRLDRRRNAAPNLRHAG